MFGYLTAYQDGLSEENKRIYQGYYCGLCEELGRHFGKKSQLILAYDLVFLAILYNALYEEEETESKKICLLKAAKTERIRTDALAYAADMNLLLSYHNYIDQAHDSKSKKARTAVKLLRKDYEKTAEKYPRQKAAVERYMKQLIAWEKAPGDNPDEAANYTGEMLSEVFLMKEDEFAVYLRPLFYYLGKYIYLCDAFVDIVDDLQSGSYNPYNGLYGEEDFTLRVQEHLESVMAEAAKAYRMLPILKHEDLLGNILYSGVWMAFGKAKSERNQVKE